MFYIQQLCQFDEDYTGMLRELSLASALDPGWAVVREKREETRVFLLSMTNLVASKAREPLELSHLIEDIPSVI